MIFRSSWPKAIVPEDPGYVLLINDPWYDDHSGYPNAKNWRKLYAADPPPNVLRDALSRQNPSASSSTSSSTKRKTKTKGTRDNERRDAGLEKLELYEGRLVARNLETNATRPLTDQELKDQIEVVPCKDKQCSEELKRSDTDLLIPALAPPSLPAANLDAVPTFTPTKSMRTEVRSQRRTNVRPDLPAATDLAVLEI